MKLENVKDIIDNYFDNISEQDFFNLITSKYNMFIEYDKDKIKNG